MGGRSSHYLLYPVPISGTCVDQLVADCADRRTRRPRLLAPTVLCAVAYSRRCDRPVPAVPPARRRVELAEGACERGVRHYKEDFFVGDTPDDFSFSRSIMVKCSVKMAPSGDRFSTETLPPCAFMISFTIARPSPAPSNCTPFPRQNLSNIRS